MPIATLAFVFPCCWNESRHLLCLRNEKLILVQRSRFNRDSFEKSVQFCTRVLGMFDDAPDGKLPDDVGMRAKYEQ